MDRLHLDGYVYPAIQMPPVDETMPQDGRLSEGPHSATSWVNMLGVPAVVVVGGFYDSGLPFGMEFSARPFSDGDLLGYAYAWEQATHHRHPPVLVERGCCPTRVERKQRARVARMIRSASISQSYEYWNALKRLGAGDLAQERLARVQVQRRGQIAHRRLAMCA